LRVFAEIEWYVVGTAKDYDPNAEVEEFTNNEQRALHQFSETTYHVRRLAMELARLLDFTEDDIVEAEKIYRALWAHEQEKGGA
jgi:hypothetical protein